MALGDKNLHIQTLHPQVFPRSLPLPKMKNEEHHAQNKTPRGFPGLLGLRIRAVRANLLPPLPFHVEAAHHVRHTFIACIDVKLFLVGLVFDEFYANNY